MIGELRSQYIPPPAEALLFAIIQLVIEIGDEFCDEE
jgi:hypothetical protein